jgi:hypothetical protein
MSLNKYLKKKYQKHYTGLILPRARKKMYTIYTELDLKKTREQPLCPLLPTRID